MKPQFTGSIDSIEEYKSTVLGEYGTTSLNTLGVTAVDSVASGFYKIGILVPYRTSFEFRIVILLDWLTTKN